MESSSRLKDYENLADQFTIESARKKFIEGVISGKYKAQDRPSLNNQLASANEVDFARSKFSESLAELSDILQRIENLDNENSNTKNVEACDEDGVIDDEIARASAFLDKLTSEKAQLDAAILEKKEKIESIKANGPDLSRLNNLTTGIPTKTTEASTVDPRVAATKASLQELEAVYAGLGNLIGVKSLEVSESALEGGVDMSMEIGRCTFRLTLNANKKLCDIEVVGGDVQKCDLAKVLQKASTMESPQDLRYSVFALGSIQQSSEIMQQHLKPILRACVVTSLGPRAFRMELRGGYVAEVAVHECYPNVPAGVKITSLTSSSSCSVGAEADALVRSLEKIRSETNTLCLSVIGDMFDYLVGPKALGSLQP